MLAVAGGKGGCGKTTTALGVARALAQRRRRPLVVDCDLDAPNLHLRADVPRDPGVDALAARGTDLDAATHASPVVPDVDVLPAGEAAGDDLVAVLDSLPERATDRPVVLDCPAGASEAAVRPLRAARDAVVVATRGREELEDAVKTAAMARAVGTPVCAGALTGATSAPRGLARALETPSVVPVPRARDPLRNRDARAAYAALVEAATPDRRTRP